MNRKMTLLALGANCNARGASGLTVACAAPEVALKYFCLLTLNLNEFVFVD